MKEKSNSSKKDSHLKNLQWSILENQICPICRHKTLILREAETEIPYFGKVYIFSMDCSNCKYHKSDVEIAEKQEPSRYEFEITKEEDLNVRVVKSSEATIKIPHIVTIEPGIAAQGYITNIEGILNRVRHMLESQKEVEEDNTARKKLKNMLKKINRVLWGQEKLKIIIEDPSGNSAIISDKAIKKKLK